MTITVPEGTSNTLRLVDTLPNGRGRPRHPGHRSRVVSIGANISNSALAVGAPGRSLGGITFNCRRNTDCQYGGRHSNALIRWWLKWWQGQPSLPMPRDLLTNRARLTYDGNNTLDASAAADVVEPNLNIDKSANPTTGLNAGDVTYTGDYTHGSFPSTWITTPSGRVDL
jgi:hypothetical protein